MVANPEVIHVAV